MADTSDVVVLESLKSTFVTLVAEDYPVRDRLEPGGAVDLTLDGLAQAIVAELEEVALQESELSGAVRDAIVRSVRYCASYLMDAYEFNSRDSDDRGSWNRGWFLHVDAALATLAEFIRNASAIDFEAGPDLVFAAMALPQPRSLAVTRRGRNSPSFASGNQPTKFVRILRESWCTEYDVQLAISRMDLAGASPNIGDLDWSGLDSRVPTSEYSIWLFSGQGRDQPDYIPFLASLTEDQFFGGAPASSQRLRVELYGETGDKGEPAAGVLLAAQVPVVPLGFNETEARFEASIWVGIEVLVAEFEEPGLLAAAQTSGLSFKLAARKSMGFVVTRSGSPRFQPDDEGALIWFAVDVTSSTAEGDQHIRWPSGPANLRLDLGKNDPLAVYLDESASCSIALLPSGVPSLVAEVFDVSKPEKAESLEVLVPKLKNLVESGISWSEEGPSIELPARSEAAAHLFGLMELGEGAGVPQANGDRGSAVVVTASDAGASVRVDNCRFPVLAESTSESDFRSPLVAALMDSSPAQGALLDVDAESLRGEIEASFVSLFAVNMEDIQVSNGHVALLAED
ncbi:MAG: hypothetical protein ACOYKM_14670, partial [Caulobacterales bacterium]